MGMLEVLKGYTPVENPEYGAKKKLIGDSVAQVQSLEKIASKKDGREWVILRCEAINAIPDPKGRETTIVAGDELTKVYDPNDAESVQDLANDLFTAGIQYAIPETEEQLIESMAKAAVGQLVYFRTWCKDKTVEQIEAGKLGAPTYFQNIIIKPKKLITPENSVPQMPF